KTVAEAKTKTKFYLGTGRRKTSVARVRIAEGGGKIQINGRELSNYFTEDKDRNSVTGPLDLTEMRNRLDVIISVNGGGYTGQAGAVCQGVARALKTMFGGTPDQTADGQEDGGGFAKKMRDSGYVTRDDRMKERNQYGSKGA